MAAWKATAGSVSGGRARAKGRKSASRASSDCAMRSKAASGMAKPLARAIFFQSFFPSVLILSTLHTGRQLGGGQDDHGGSETPDEDGRGVAKDPVLALKLDVQERPHQQEHVLRGFQYQSRQNRHGGHAGGRDAAVRQNPVDQEQYHDTDGDGGHLEDQKLHPQFQVG